MEALYSKHAHLERPLLCFMMLRGSLAIPIERLILIDRLLFLEESGDSTEEPTPAGREAPTGREIPAGGAELVATAPPLQLPETPADGGVAAEGMAGGEGGRGGGSITGGAVRVALVPLFDELLSPRNTAVVAFVAPPQTG